MKSNYVIWDTKDVPHACCLGELTGVAKQYQLMKGLPRAADFPIDAYFSMNPDFPHDTVLTDNLINFNRMIVASLRVKEFLEARRLPRIEYLPVKILDHKKRPANREYFILHCLDPVDCLDIEKCGATRSKIDKESIQRIERLVIDESRVDPGREMFRPKFFNKISLVHRRLARAMDREGFTAIGWKDLDDYPRPESGAQGKGL